MKIEELLTEKELAVVMRDPASHRSVFELLDDINEQESRSRDVTDSSPAGRHLSVCRCSWPRPRS